MLRTRYYISKYDAMQLNALILLGILCLACNAANSPFKTCAEIDFCKKLRNNTPAANERYKADLSTLVTKNDVVQLNLKNGQNKILVLLITWHTGVARIKIQEPNSNRFALMTGLALEKEPVNVGIKATVQQNTLVITNTHNADRIVIQNSPEFSLKAFNIHNMEVLELKGDRLVMENNNNDRSFAFGVDFKATLLYGLFDHAHKMALSQTAHTNIDPFRLRNSDDWGYKVDSTTALYGNVPVIYGHSAQQTSGIFLHNAAEQWVDISYSNKDPNAYFMVDTASFDLFILFGPTPVDVVRQFTGLTGKAPLPQLWTLGYHQCRHAYKSQEEVKQVVSLFVQNDFPLDAIWLDDLHTDAYRYFKWNASTFSNPVEMLNNISHYGKVAVSISDPHFKIDMNYAVYAGAKGKYFVKNANGEDFIGYSWPGAASWIDFLNPDAAKYYGSWYAYNKFNGSTPVIAGIWNDMNEPSLFVDNSERTFPFDVVHTIDSKGTKVKHRELHNIYGLSHVRATYSGLLARDANKKRPFILTRSHFAGSQRYAAMWTGDNNPTFEHFATSISQCLSGNMVGMVFCGADVAGFGGNPTSELLQRWYQGAIWLPFFRGHSETWTQRREPYLFPAAIQKVLRTALKLRYAHLPYLYTLFYETSTFGDPLISPLFYRYPGVQEHDSQILVGEAIMATPVVKSGVSSREVYFPGKNTDVWYRIDRPNSNEIYHGGDTKQVSVDIETAPVFYKSGTVVMTYAVVKGSSSLMQHSDLLAYVNLDTTGKASGKIYIDDYTSFDHIIKEDFAYFEISTNHTGENYHVEFKRIGGKSQQFKPTVKSIVVRKPQNKATGQLEATQLHFDKTKDGLPLTTIQITDGTVIKL